MKFMIRKVDILHPLEEKNRKVIFSFEPNKKVDDVEEYKNELKIQYPNSEILLHYTDNSIRTEMFRKANSLMINQKFAIDKYFCNVASQICNKLSKNNKLFIRKDIADKMYIIRIK